MSADFVTSGKAKNAPKSSPGAPQDALGARFLPHTVSGLGFDAFWTPWDLGNRAPMYTGARFLENHLFEPGAGKGPQNDPKIDPKTAQEAPRLQNLRSKPELNFDRISTLISMIFGAIMDPQMDPNWSSDPICRNLDF